MSKTATDSKTQVFLDELDLNVTGPIVAMICRKWDVNAVTGRYLSTDFLISDGKGNTMHCTAKSKTSHNFVDRLKDGIIYTINDFVVRPNTEEYRIKKESAYMIEFHGGTTVRRSPVKADGFVRHHFDLIDFNDLQVSNNKYLEHSAEDRFQDPRFLPHQSKGQSVRVTLWGSIGDVLIEKKIKNVGLHAVILTSVNVKLYNKVLGSLKSNARMCSLKGNV
ncbi:hypothetical protein OROMI_023487 [Orobanche minor]